MRKILGIVPTAGAALAFVALTAAPAQAALVVDGSLTLDTDPATIYQQTEASPCVIGGNNCLNGSFDYTVVGSGGKGTAEDADSPTYLVSDITAVTGSNAFTIGLDYNQTVNPQTLTSFSAIFDVGGTQTFDIPTVLQVNNNGVGFSDFLLSGFVIPVGATTVTFNAVWFNNDGPDRYFLIGADAVPCDPNCPPIVPEPTMLALMGIGMLGAGLARRRVKQQ